MAVFNGNKAFRQKRHRPVPVVPVPKTVKEALNVAKAYENGCFRLEPKKRNTLYDRCYLFEDVNYINKDKGEKRLFLSELMDFLNGMEVHFKISLCNSYQSMEAFLSSVRNEKQRSLSGDRKRDPAVAGRRIKGYEPHGTYLTASDSHLQSR